MPVQCWASAAEQAQLETTCSRRPPDPARAHGAPGKGPEAVSVDVSFLPELGGGGWHPSEVCYLHVLTQQGQNHKVSTLPDSGVEGVPNGFTLTTQRVPGSM